MTSATWIKICGIDNEQSALCALAAGADAIGLMFAPQSARRLTLRQAAGIVAAVDGQLPTVGVFVDQDEAFVAQTASELGLDLLQFHGAEPRAYCAQFAKPYIKAFRAGVEQPHWIRQHYADAWAWMLDSANQASFGGTGEAFDLSLWPSSEPGPWLLAGGLTADNVGAAVLAVQPKFVDVSSGVESGRRGCKDPTKIEAFVRAVREADRELALVDSQGAGR